MRTYGLDIVNGIRRFPLYLPLSLSPSLAHRASISESNFHNGKYESNLPRALDRINSAELCHDFI